MRKNAVTKSKSCHQARTINMPNKSHRSTSDLPKKSAKETFWTLNIDILQTIMLNAWLARIETSGVDVDI